MNRLDSQEFVCTGPSVDDSRQPTTDTLRLPAAFRSSGCRRRSIVYDRVGLGLLDCVLIGGAPAVHLLWASLVQCCIKRRGAANAGGKVLPCHCTSPQTQAPPIKRSTEARGTCPQCAALVFTTSAGILSGDCYSDCEGPRTGSN